MCMCVCVLLSVCVIKGLGLFVVLLCAFIGGVVTTVTQSVMSVGWVRCVFIMYHGVVNKGSP